MTPIDEPRQIRTARQRLWQARRQTRSPAADRDSDRCTRTPSGDRRFVHGFAPGPAILLALALTGCNAVPMVHVPSENRNQRVSHLILHFTSENFAESLRVLTQQTSRPVSAHYLLPHPADPSYPHRDLRVYRLVPEAERAWHAGRSGWFGRTSLNDSSIGIEIVNLSGCTEPEQIAAAPQLEEPAPDGATPNSVGPDSLWPDNAWSGALAHALPPEPACTFLPYDDAQIELLIRLIRDILARNPDIGPVDVTGHADIAPGRRVDPGPLFPWQRLYRAGIGAWYDEATMARYLDEFETTLPELSLLQAALSAYGYDVEINGTADDRTRFAVRAFQMHFRPADHDGIFDAETAAILFALLEKYRAASMAERNEDALARPLEASEPPQEPGERDRRQAW